MVAHTHKVTVTTLELLLQNKKDQMRWGGFQDPPNQLRSDRTGQSHHETIFLFTSVAVTVRLICGWKHNSLPMLTFCQVEKTFVEQRKDQCQGVKA